MCVRLRRLRSPPRKGPPLAKAADGDARGADVLVTERENLCVVLSQREMGSSFPMGEAGGQRGEIWPGISPIREKNNDLMACAFCKMGVKVALKSNAAATYYKWATVSFIVFLKF